MPTALSTRVDHGHDDREGSLSSYRCLPEEYAGAFYPPQGTEGTIVLPPGVRLNDALRLLRGILEGRCKMANGSVRSRDGIVGGL